MSISPKLTVLKLPERSLLVAMALMVSAAAFVLVVGAGLVHAQSGTGVPPLRASQPAQAGAAKENQRGVPRPSVIHAPTPQAPPAPGSNPRISG